jgi:hypothetical protein
LISEIICFHRLINGFETSAFKYRDGNLWLAKCTEPLNIIWSRLLPDGTSPSTVTVKLEPSGRWFVSLLIDDPTVQPLPPTDKKVGIDVGISSLLTTSDGQKIANPKHFNRLYQKLKVAQKELNILGVEWNKHSGKCGLGVSPSEAPFQDSTSGQEGSASENEGKRGERCTSTVDE